MLTEYGMSEGLGPQTFDTDQGQVFLGKELTRGHQYSDSIARKIDDEVGSLLRRAREAADKVVEHQRIRLSRLVEELLAEETLQGTALQNLLIGDKGNAGSCGVAQRSPSTPQQQHHRPASRAGGLRSRPSASSAHGPQNRDAHFWCDSVGTSAATAVLIAERSAVDGAWAAWR